MTSTAPPHLSAAEAAVIEALYPEGLTEPMREVALCLFESLAQQDARCGQAQPQGSWLQALQAFARLALAQLAHLSARIGGSACYFAKGAAVFLSARDRAMCAKFNGRNYHLLAREYGLTEMRVRQILQQWHQEQVALRQGQLPL